MKTEKIKWNDFSEKTPPPQYVNSDSDIIVEYDNERIKMFGQCLFPSNDNTLNSRNHANHFHIIMLFDVIYALNVIWNGARIVKEKLGWTEMFSITTKSKITQKIELDKKYTFEIEANKAKMNIWKINMYIKDQEKIIAEVETTAHVK